jgi:hypothetical protein
MTDREIMQKALEALEWNLPVIEDYGDHEQLNRQHRAITALRERLAQPEPVIDKAAAIRIATVLGWEPPREEQEQEPTVKWDASAPLVVHPHPAFQATLVAEQERKRWHKAGARAIRMAINIEREACAKVCDELAARDKLSNYYAVAAKAIRARGQG